MSYINDALRKAQKDKQSPYAAYEPIVSASGENIKKSRRWIATAGISIFLLWVIIIIVFFYRPEEKKVAGKPVTFAGAPAAVPAVTQPANVIPADNKIEPLPENKPAGKDIKSGPERMDAKTLYAQAVKKHQEGNLEEAKRLYKQVIRTDPRNVEALNNLGVIYMKKKVYKWAIIRLNDAINVKHNYADAHYNLACIYAQQNDFNRSLSYLKNAVGFNPQVRTWAESDRDLKVLADLPEFKKLLEKK